MLECSCPVQQLLYEPLPFPQTLQAEISQTPVSSHREGSDYTINQSINPDRQTDNLQKKRLTEIGLFVRGVPVVELNPLSDDDDGTTEELPNQLLPLLLQETLCCNLDLHVVKQCGCC
jgi:hypothetical protein